MTAVRCGGQAMVEFLVGLVAVLVLVAGLLQVASLGLAQTRGMVSARQEAATLAMLEPEDGLGLLSAPDYLADWDEGPDGKRHSADDQPVPDASQPFTQNLVEKAAADETGWDILGRAPDNRLSNLRNHPAPASVFGLVKGDSTETVTLIPAVRSLIYRADQVEIESTVWMTWLKGIY